MTTVTPDPTTRVPDEIVATWDFSHMNDDAASVGIRELVFKVRGTGVWTTEEGDEHMSVAYVHGRGKCPHCGHDAGPLEVGLNQYGEPFTTIMFCPARIQSPWWHTCGRPILLVPEDAR